MSQINAIVRLRRDNDYNYEKIKNSFVPANGEVCLVDTANDGLRAKVGDGYSTFAQLQYTDQDIRNSVLQGYYIDNAFYKDPQKQTLFSAMVNKIYIDKFYNRIYYYNGAEYIIIQENSYSTATDLVAGMVKLYSTTGQNIDGTMTQKAITDELEVRYKASIDSENEMLIFSL